MQLHVFIVRRIFQLLGACLLCFYCGAIGPCAVEAQSPPNSYPKNVDLGVSGILLTYRQSAEDVLGNQLVLSPAGNRRELLRCTSSNKKELLELVHYTGRWKNSFQQFRVVGQERRKALEVSAETAYSSLGPSPTGSSSEQTKVPAPCVLPVERFTSFRGIKLGMSLSEVTSYFGSQFKVDTQGPYTVIIYSIETNLTSDFLRHYDALSYYARYYFHGGKLVEYSFGIDNL
jgi:hypothetical protein